MSSANEYEQQNFWKTQDLSLLGDTWMDQQVARHKKYMLEEGERLFYAAQEGSILDKIWKGEFKNNDNERK